MWVAIGLVAFVASIALAIAVGVSLGRNGDREDEDQFRHQVGEALAQLDERVRHLEPDEDDPDLEQPDDLGKLGNAGY